MLQQSAAHWLCCTAVGEDHSEVPPWLTFVSDGGTKPNSGGKAGAAWVEYLSLSNELVTPRVLACPGDTGGKVASDWGTGPNGLLNPGFRQQAISYLLGLHAYAERPMALVAADCNIRLVGPFGCGPTAVMNASGIVTTVGSPPPETAQWSTGPHGSAGHLLVVDGSVAFLDSAGLTRTLSMRNSTDNGAHHVLRAH